MFNNMFERPRASVAPPCWEVFPFWWNVGSSCLSPVSLCSSSPQRGHDCCFIPLCCTDMGLEQGHERGEAELICISSFNTQFLVQLLTGAGRPFCKGVCWVSPYKSLSPSTETVAFALRRVHGWSRTLTV